MPTDSTYTLVKRLEAEVIRIIASAQAADLIDQQAQRELKLLRRDLTDARLDVRDYELAETRAEQAKLGHDAAERLKVVRQSMVVVSQYGIFSAIEIAQLSAQLEAIVERLRYDQ